MALSPEELELKKTFNKVRILLEKNFSQEEIEKIVENDEPALDTVRETLDAFKDHIGAEHYAALAGGPAFSDMFDRWLRNRAEDRIDTIWERLQERLPEVERERLLKPELRQFLFVFAGI